MMDGHVEVAHVQGGRGDRPLGDRARFEIAGGSRRGEDVDRERPGRRRFLLGQVERLLGAVG
jgi:hypothetical protein